VKKNGKSGGSTAMPPWTHGRAPSTTSHGGPHRHPMVAPAQYGINASQTLCFGALLFRGFLPWIICLGLLGFFY